MTHRPLLKVCGINDAAFAARAAALGVDYLGFIFEPSSPRAVTPGWARATRAALPRSVTVVGVFVHQTVGEIRSVVDDVGLDVVQLHRAATDDEIRALQKAGVRVWTLDDGIRQDGGVADGIVVDGRDGARRRPSPSTRRPLRQKDGARSGGTGRLADWPRAHQLSARDVFTILAGGLGAENLAAAAETGAAVLDANSALETAPGVKSIRRLEALMR